MFDKHNFVSRMRKKLSRLLARQAGRLEAAELLGAAESIDSTKPKVSPRSPVSFDLSNLPKTLPELLAKIKETHTELGTHDTYCSELLELIGPKVLEGFGTSEGATVNSKEAKLWASACSKMLGLLAGLHPSIPEHQTDLAIDEMAKEAKRHAKLACHLVKKPARVKAANRGAGSTNRQIKEMGITTKEGIIRDLESQIMLETELAVKVALQTQADRLKKEIELERAQPDGKAA